MQGEGSRALGMGVEHSPDAPSHSFQSLPLVGTPSALPGALVFFPPLQISNPLRIGPRLSGGGALGP